MSLRQENSTDMGLDKLRVDAAHRADRLLKQLLTNQADLTRWRQRRHQAAIDIEPGLGALAEAIKATKRVRAELQRG
jgi:hypothetical protein